MITAEMDAGDIALQELIDSLSNPDYWNDLIDDEDDLTPSDETVAVVSHEVPVEITSPSGCSEVIDAGDAALNKLIASLTSPNESAEPEVGYVVDDVTTPASTGLLGGLDGLAKATAPDTTAATAVPVLDSSHAPGDVMPGLTPSMPATDVVSADSMPPASRAPSEVASAVLPDAPMEVASVPSPAVSVESTETVKEVQTERMFVTFPVSDLPEVGESNDHLKAMKVLCRELLLHKDYARVRTEYCVNSICLNLMGKLAPAFRPVLKPCAERGDEVHHQINRDQVVIDLHWCHLTKMRLIPYDASFISLFSDPTDFPFDLAYLLASKTNSNCYRAAEALCLTTLQQCQLLKLRGPELVARRKELDKGWRATKGASVSKIAAAKRQLTQWAERDSRMDKFLKSHEMLWLARELLEPGAKLTQIATLHGLMLGETALDKRTIGGKLEKLDKNVCMS